MTSSLIKDMNSTADLYRANAIRVLCRNTNGGLLGQIEWYFKQAVMDKNLVVLVNGIDLLQSNPEIVKRWSNKVQEAMQSKAPLVQFHALVLLHQVLIPPNLEQADHSFFDCWCLSTDTCEFQKKLRQICPSDRLAVSKLISSLSKGTVRLPLA